MGVTDLSCCALHLARRSYKGRDGTREEETLAPGTMGADVQWSRQR